MISKFVIFILFLFPITLLSAQIPPLIEFELYDLEDSESNITGIFADSRGFLWIRTEAGVFRYDGKTYVHLKKELAAALVLDIAESPDGILWFATGGGITRFDAEKWEFTNFYHDTQDKTSLGHSFVNDLHFDSQGELWIAHDLGIDRYDKNSGKFIHFGLNPEYETDKNSGPWGGKITEDSNGNLWVGYQSPALLDRFDRDTGLFYATEYRPSDSYLDREFIRDLIEYKGKLWISTSKTALYSLDLKTSKTKHYQYKPDNSTCLPAEDVYQCYLDSSGKFWVASDNAISLFSSDFSSFTHIYPDNDDPMKMKDGTKNMTEDKAGNLWFVSWADVYRSSFNFYSFETIPTNRFATYMIRDSRKGGYWISTIGAGLLHSDDDYNIDRTYFENSNHYTVLFDKEGSLWTNESGVGLHCMLPDEDEFELYIQEDIDEQLKWAMVITDNRGNLWALGWEQAFLWDGKQKKFLPFLYDHLDKETGELVQREFTGWDLRNVFIDSFGGTWIGTADGLFLARTDERGHKWFRSDSQDSGSLSNNTITGLTEDDTGDLWISTLEGLNRYVRKTDSFQITPMPNGLSSFGFASLIQDSSGILWLGTSKGIARYDPSTGDSYFYDRTDGVFSADGLSCATIDQDGIIYMGGFAGVTRFNPFSVKRRVFEPPIAFTGFEMGDSSSGIISSSSSPGKLELPWTANSISLSFAALDLTNPKGVSYKVKLEGWDKNWLSLGSRNSVRYTNLPGGDYNFLVQATNSHGLWTSEGAWGRFPVFIKTHPLKTRLAYGSYLLLGSAVLAFLFLRYRTVQQKKLIREQVISDHLRKVDNLKDQFLANTTHELRTPLNGIIGLAESLIDNSSQNISEGTKKELSIIASSGRRLSFLINDILDFSRLKEGDIQLHKGPVNIARLVNTVLVLSKPLLQSKDVVMQNLIPDDLPLASGDINRVQQIFHNLIGNAIKFTEKGEISVSAVLIGSFLEVRVSDTGIGIEEDQKKLIWQSFQQVDGGADREFSGSGLGLPITRKLVELHGGVIDVISEPGRGSSFIFTLPKSEQPENLLQMERSISSLLPQEVNSSSISHVQEFETATILLVDDEALNRHVVESQLSDSHYSLLLTSSGQEALNLLENTVPDLILLDIMMPFMDGYEVCRKIREKFSVNELPIIMITARNQVADLVEGLTLGANDFISKPYSGKELLARIETHLELKRNHQEYGRFVPKDLLKILKRERSEPAEKDMTLMMTSLSLANDVEEKDLFTFLAAFLPEVFPVIRRNGGILFRYEGQGILSFFPESSGNAFHAALEIQKLVGQFNQKSNKMSELIVESSFHGERLLIGLVGDESFTEKLVISGAIEQTLKLNRLGKLLNCPIVAGESAMRDRVSDSRLLAFLYNDDDSKTFLKVFEIFPQDTEISERKIKSSTEFEEALYLFYGSRYDAASVKFGKILEQNPDDHAAVIYRNRCAFYMHHPPENGIVSLI